MLPAFQAARLMLHSCQTLPSGIHGQDERNGHKLRNIKFYLNTRNNSFVVKVVKHWHRFPRKSVESLCLEIFKSHLDIDLGK